MEGKNLLSGKGNRQHSIKSGVGLNNNDGYLNDLINALKEREKRWIRKKGRMPASSISIEFTKTGYPKIDLLTEPRKFKRGTDYNPVVVDYGELEERTPYHSRRNSWEVPRYWKEFTKY